MKMNQQQLEKAFALIGVYQSRLPDMDAAKLAYVAAFEKESPELHCFVGMRLLDNPLAILSKKQLDGLTFPAGEITNLDLRESSMIGTDLSESFFCSCDLRGVTLQDAYTSGAFFESCLPESINNVKREVSENVNVLVDGGDPSDIEGEAIDEKAPLPLRYCSIDRASSLLGCEPEDIMHWASIGAINVMINADTTQLFRNGQRCAPDNSTSEWVQYGLSRVRELNDGLGGFWGITPENAYQIYLHVFVGGGGLPYPFTVDVFSINERFTDLTTTKWFEPVEAHNSKMTYWITNEALATLSKHIKSGERLPIRWKGKSI